MTQKLLTKQIEFELTNFCNANCLFCPREGVIQKGFLSFDLLKKGVDLAKKCGIKGFKISGFGEPTLHKELVAFLKHIRKEMPAAFILLITNAYKLDHSLFEELANIPINRINISFNGYDQESYEKQMKGLRFEVTMANLAYIAQNNNCRINIQFTPVLSKLFGMPEIEKMHHLLEGIGFKPDNFGLHHIITSRAEKIKHAGLTDQDFIDQLKDIEIKDRSKVLCLRHLGTLYVDWQGRIHLCCNDIYGEAIIGRLDELNSCEDLVNLEQKNISLRKSYHYDICKKCDRPLIGPHKIKGDSFFSL